MTEQQTRILNSKYTPNKTKVYQRCWDFTEYPKEKMQQYGLENARYYYIGCTTEDYMSNRTAKWIDCLKNKKCDSGVIDFIEKAYKFYIDEYQLQELKGKKLRKALLPIMFEPKLLHMIDGKGKSSKELGLKLEKTEKGRIQQLELSNDILEHKSYLISKEKAVPFIVQQDGAVRVLKLKEGYKDA